MIGLERIDPVWTGRVLTVLEQRVLAPIAPAPIALAPMVRRGLFAQTSTDQILIVLASVAPVQIDLAPVVPVFSRVEIAPLRATDLERIGRGFDLAVTGLAWIGPPRTSLVPVLEFLE